MLVQSATENPTKKIIWLNLDKVEYIEEDDQRYASYQKKKLNMGEQIFKVSLDEERSIWILDNVERIFNRI